MLPLLAVISSRQYFGVLVQRSHGVRILASSSDHAHLSTSEQVRRKRLSSTLARRRAARHSASNHGVDCLRLRKGLCVADWGYGMTANCTGS